MLHNVGAGVPESFSVFLLSPWLSVVPAFLCHRGALSLHPQHTVSTSLLSEFVWRFSVLWSSLSLRQALCAWASGDRTFSVSWKAATSAFHGWSWTRVSCLSLSNSRPQLVISEGSRVQESFPFSPLRIEGCSIVFPSTGNLYLCPGEQRVSCHLSRGLRLLLHETEDPGEKGLRHSVQLCALLPYSQSFIWAPLSLWEEQVVQSPLVLESPNW